MAPLLDNSSWDMKCTKEINAFTTQITYARLKVSLGNCSCTDEYDCNSNGRSRGDKETGPNCRCFCNETWTGDNCETPLCKAPRVLNARSPACREGWYFKPGEICTPDCAENFAPNVPSFLCNETMEPASLDPTVFECRRQQSAVGGEDTENALPPVTGILPRCTNADCSFRGTATGWRPSTTNIQITYKQYIYMYIYVCGWGRIYISAIAFQSSRSGTRRPRRFASPKFSGDLYKSLILTPAPSLGPHSEL